MNVHDYFCFTNWIFNNSSSFQAVISDVRDGKFYPLLPEKENTGSVAQLRHNFLRVNSCHHS